ncbi:helix-turn-helix domain-containing protein [Burkholderiaceae bacterium UC74_6]
MQVPITSTGDLGEIIRSVRKASGIRIDDAAAMTGVSKQFASDVEHGKPTVEFGRVLLLLKELGIELHASITSDAEKELAQLRASGGITTGKDRWKPIFARTARIHPDGTVEILSKAPEDSASRGASSGLPRADE